MHTLFSNTCALLSNYEWIHNFQVTDVFKGDVLSKIPANWHSCLAQLNTEEINEVPFLGAECRLKYPEWPSSLHDFITNSTELSSLKDVDLQESEVKHIEVSHDMARGMNRKKLHEVTRMASLVYETARKTNCNVVIDVGSGLGYLDHVIHQKYGINVLGMETVQSHVSAAETRAVKQGITCGGIKSLQCHIADNTDSFENFVSTVESVCPTLQCKCTERLTDSREWETKATSGVSAPKICLIGLHCCGDLSTTMMSYFSSYDKIKAICCVCCCYHKMTYSEEKFAKFPLSDAGKESYMQLVEKHGKHFFTPYTLRLGAQETRHRWHRQTKSDHDSHINHVAFRGLLSLTDEEEGSIRQRVRHCDFNNFQAFQDSFYGPSGENSSVDDQRNKLTSLYDEHKKDFAAIEILTLLQVILQPVIETLLYQDRAQWLKEQGHKNVTTVPVFDEIISPRNLALVALKVLNI